MQADSFGEEVRPEQFKTSCRVDIPEYCGGTYCDVYAMGDHDSAPFYGHIMTDKGVFTRFPDGSLHKTCLDKEADKALHLALEDVPRGKMIIMSGPSGSGKSTISRQMLKDDGNAIRINRDDLRRMVIGKWSKSKESTIVAFEKALAKAARDLSHVVIIDDTNLTDHHKNLWLDFAKETHFKKAEIHYVKQDLLTCVERDNQRSPYERVGRAVIELQFLRGKLIDWGTKPVICCDIDGTIANLTHRYHLASGICPVCNGDPVLESGDVAGCSNCASTGKVKKDWVAFEKACDKDTPVEAVVKWLRALAEDHTIVLLSGRRISLAGYKTVDWLAKIEAPYDHLFMRNGTDGRKDTEVKNEILQLMLDSGLPKEQIEFAIDDRRCVIDQVWRAHGIKVYPVFCDRILE